MVTEESERQAFDSSFSPEVFDMVVLTSSLLGACKSGQQELWTASAEINAYLDDAGSFVEVDGRLEWLAGEDDRETWIHDLHPNTQYRVRVRRALPPDPAAYAWRTEIGIPLPDRSHTFMLVDLLERDMHLAVLEQRRERYLTPCSLENDLGTFVLDRRSDSFLGEITWHGISVRALLAMDAGSPEGGETADRALEVLRPLVRESADIDRRWRSFIAHELTDLANDWQREDFLAKGAPLLTEGDIIRRIWLTELSVSADGSVTPGYADDDIFFGHTIIINVEPDGTMKSATIAG